MDGLSKYARIMLDCGNADFAMLDNVFSELSEDAHARSNNDLEEVIKEAESLNDLLGTVYNNIQYEVAMYILTHSKSRYIKGKASELITQIVIPNCLATRFDTDLDEVVQWNEDVQNNAKKLWRYWLNECYDNFNF